VAIKTFSIIFLFCIGSIAGAASNTTPELCTTIDFSNKFGPVWDQGKTGFCYAVAISDFLSYYENRRVSATDVAAVNLDLASVFERSVRRMVMGRQNWTQGELPGRALKRLGEAGLCFDENALPMNFDVLNILIAAGTITYQNTCQIGKRSGPFRIEVDEFGPGIVGGSIDEVIPTINLELENQRIIMMVYNAGTAFPKIAPSNLHVSTIVGRRWNSGNQVCEYMIRNSWGPSYGDSGYMWLSKSILVRSVDSIYALRSLKNK
jgi:Papain family cysteine protease